jgi:hypothetical protein
MDGSSLPFWPSYGSHLEADEREHMVFNSESGPLLATDYHDAKCDFLDPTMGEI